MTAIARPNAGFSDRLIHGSIAFLVLLFAGFQFFLSHIWVVTAGNMRVQEELTKQLPTLGLSAGPDMDVMAEEVTLWLSETGMPNIEDEPVFDLPKALEQLRTNAGLRKLIVTVQAEAQTPFGDVLRTLDALTQAKIANVTFVVGSEEGF